MDRLPSVLTPGGAAAGDRGGGDPGGAYLARHVTLCVDCHAQRDWRYFSGPVVEGTEGLGGARYGPEMGFPGEIFTPNITPHALGDWTDGEILRAFTEGVSRDGRALFPLMPYRDYGALSREDALALVAFLRTLAPIPQDVPPRRLTFPLNVLVRTFPRRAALKEKTPTPEGGLRYGKYLTTIAGCRGCHTPVDDRGRPRSDLAFAGGHAFRFPNGAVVRSANITPHPTAGIGEWSREAFIARFRARSPEAVRSMPAGPANTVMPWSSYAGMTDQDLGAIYDYLMSLPSVDHPVEVWPGE